MFEVFGVKFESWRQFYQLLGVKGTKNKFDDPIKFKIWLLKRLNVSTDKELVNALSELKNKSLASNNILDDVSKTVLKTLLDNYSTDKISSISGLDQDAVDRGLTQLKALL